MSGNKQIQSDPTPHPNQGMTDNTITHTPKPNELKQTTNHKRKTTHNYHRSQSRVL